MAYGKLEARRGYLAYMTGALDPERKAVAEATATEWVDQWYVAYDRSTWNMGDMPVVAERSWQRIAAAEFLELDLAQSNPNVSSDRAAQLREDAERMTKQAIRSETLTLPNGQVQRPIGQGDESAGSSTTQEAVRG